MVIISRFDHVWILHKPISLFSHQYNLLLLLSPIVKLYFKGLLFWCWNKTQNYTSSISYNIHHMHEFTHIFWSIIIFIQCTSVTTVVCHFGIKNPIFCQTSSFTHSRILNGILLCKNKKFKLWYEVVSC